MLRVLLAVAVLLPFDAGAAPQKSCPPLGALPNAIPDDAALRNYGSREFERLTGNGDETETVAVAGRTWPPTNEEINYNDHEAFKALGAEILYTGRRETVARVFKDGQVIRMRAYAGETSVEVRVELVRS